MCDRINYAVLGNVIPHVHAHVVPRYGLEDPAPGQAPWAIQDSRKPLGEDRIADLRSSIARQLTSTSGPNDQRM
jgi:diadenosine tetraphosphate (Ap4A) HIT family hydrolase